MFHFGLIVLKLVSDGRVSVGNLADILLLLFFFCCCWVVAGYIYINLQQVLPIASELHRCFLLSLLMLSDP